MPIYGGVYTGSITKQTIINSEEAGDFEKETKNPVLKMGQKSCFENGTKWKIFSSQITCGHWSLNKAN